MFLTTPERIEIVERRGGRSARVIAAEFNARHPEREKIFHFSDTITSQQGNVGGNGLHHCSSEIKLVLNDISHAPLPI
jgi:hypothetical protein